MFIASPWTMMVRIEAQTGGTLTDGATFEHFKAWLLRGRRATRDGTEGDGGSRKPGRLREAVAGFGLDDAASADEFGKPRRRGSACACGRRGGAGRA